jgi:hypothetical protein
MCVKLKVIVASGATGLIALGRKKADALSDAKTKQSLKNSWTKNYWKIKMFEIFFIILLVFIVARVVGQSVKPPQVEKPPCPPHKWTYDTTDQMFCTVCKRRPGEITSDYDKPY